MTAKMPIVRVGLHPADAEHESLLACWRDVLGQLLRQRTAMTKSQLVSATAPLGDDREAVLDNGAFR